ncbi:CPBP family intramembrane glutamic endopeptidase [Polaromonas sp. CT11-55]|uniref:CPBP family intramembrane glutamic endopeptidase n=1 Tax=Polaromonas sp. CT11-55 TaxID=3243045 RepID=UPI0039A787CC
MSQAPRLSTITLLDAVVVSVICFGLAIAVSIQAVLAGFPEARFTESGNTSMIGVEVGLSLTALAYLYIRGFDVSSLYPGPTIRGSLSGIGLFVLAWLVGILAVTPFASSHKPQMVEFSFTGISLASTIMFAMVNGAFEEIFLLGVLVRGLRGLGLSLAIGIPLLVRILYHLYQGPLGAVWVLAFGLTFSLFYLRSQKLWPPVLAHILWDIVPVIASAG